MTFCQLLAFVLVRCGFKPGPILVIGILDVLVNLPKFILQQINDYFGKIKYPQEFFSLIFNTLKGCRLSAINCTYKVTFPTRELLRFSITRLTASCWTGSKYLISGLANVFSESFENFSDLRLKTLTQNVPQGRKQMSKEPCTLKIHDLRKTPLEWKLKRKQGPPCHYVFDFPFISIS